MYVGAYIYVHHMQLVLTMPLHSVLRGWIVVIHQLH
jgi:hypothetical protein